MSLPKISIVTPSFNQGQYLEQTIQSVLEQNYPNIEYVIVDGGSTDNSVEIIKKYEKHLARWVTEKDNGQSHAINKGFAKATGDIHAYINSDDYYAPGAFQAVADAFMSGAQWVVGWTRFIEPGDREWPFCIFPHNEPSDWFALNPIPQPSSFWSGRVHREIGPMREDLHYSFDYEFWMRLRFKAGISPTVLRRCLSVFRMHDSSKTISQNDRFDPENQSIWNEYIKLLPMDDRAAVRELRREMKSRALRASVWQAFKIGDIATARKAAISALGLRPLSLKNWKTALCAVRGH